MQYRKFGKLDWQASILGFGAMRLPQTDNKPGNIDEPESILMIRYAIEHGVNYIDTAYPYHEGKSEVVVGKALKDGYRQKVKVATKLPSWRVHSKGDFDIFLDEQLKRLDIDKIDFYLLHGLNHEMWPKLRDLDILKSAESAVKDGRIGHIGFSFHDEYPAFKEIIDAYDGWTLSQMQYNFMDENVQAGTKGLEYAAGKGMAVVIMEPLRGGRLTKNPPESVTRLWVNAQKKRTPAEWGLLWVWNHPEVSVVLSGMTRLEHAVENVEAANYAGPNMLTAEELALFGNVREAYNKLIPIPCTGCGYCLPCPNGVQIPVILELYNDAKIYGDPTNAQFRYSSPVGLKETERADRCVECSNCVTACPQGINVPEWLRKAHELLAKPK